MTNGVEEITVTREKALEAIDGLKQRYGERAEKLGEANEAKTRLLLIDTILTNVLGWSRDDFNPEERAGHLGYIDYLLSSHNAPRLVVEAKRVNYTFGSPNKKSKRNSYQTRYFRTAYGPAFTEVLEQAQRYALQKNVPFALLTNGAEWVLVQLTLSPGFKTIDDLRGFHFGNILSSEFKFDLFWEILYKPHVEEGTLETYLADLNSREADFSRSPQTLLGDFKWQSRKDSSLLRDFYFYFFDQIVDSGRRKMLEMCFVSDPQLHQYEGELQRTLRDTVPSFIHDGEDISPKEYTSILDLKSGDQKGRVVLIVGSVGCGKSTFVTKVLVESRQGDSLIST